VNFYTIPPGVIGMQATASTWARLARTGSPMPPTWTLSDGDMEIRFYRYALADLDELTAASLGLVILRPGAVVPVQDDVPVPVAPDLTVDPRRRRGRSARRQRPRSR